MTQPSAPAIAATQIGSTPPAAPAIGQTIVGTPLVEPAPAPIGATLVGGAGGSEPPPATHPMPEAAPPPPPTQGPVTVPRPPKRSNAAFIVASIGFIVLLAGGIAAWKLLLARPPALPFELAKLPSDTMTVRRESETRFARDLWMRAEDVPDEARWSFYASTMCGGDDVFPRLMQIDEDDPSWVATLLADKEEEKATLSCGKKIADALAKKDVTYDIVFKKGKQLQAIGAIALDVKDLPDTTKRFKSTKDPDHVENTRCLHDANEVTPAGPDRQRPAVDDDYDPEHKKRDRSPDANCPRVVAKIEKEKIWITGNMPALKEFGEEWSPDAKNRIEDAKLFQDVLAGQRGDSIAAGHGDDKTGLEPLGVVRDEEVRTRGEKALRDVKVWGLSASENGLERTVRVEYHTAKESDAKDVEDALNRYLKELKRQTKEEEREAKDDDESEAKKTDAPKGPHRAEARRKVRGAILSAQRRGYEDAIVERSGEVVVVKLEFKPNDSEKKAWKEFNDWNRDRAKKVAAIVAALAKGNDVSDDDVKALSDDAFAALHPPEFVELAGLGGLRVPGGATCYAVDATSHSCTYAKLARGDVVNKLREQAEKAGFTFGAAPYSDTTFVAQKESTLVTISLFESAAGGVHVSLVLQPPPPPAPASTQ